VLHDAAEVSADMVPAEIVRPAGGAEPAHAPGPAPAVEAEPDPEAALGALVGTPLADVERRFIQKTISACDGSIPKAARLLGVSPSTLYRKRESWAQEE
jgi:DNA-binding NtrC family response regulator